MSDRERAIKFARLVLTANIFPDGEMATLAREFLSAIEREEFPLMVLAPDGTVERMAARFDGEQPEIQMTDGRTIMRGWPFSAPLTGTRESGPVDA